jgi:hypothetical protein
MGNFIELETPSFDEGYFRSMTRSGVVKSGKAIVNIAEISSIKRYVGTCLHDGWDCSKVTMNNGTSFIDKRSPEELLKAIS